MAGSINSNYPSYGGYSQPWERLRGTPLESIGKNSPGTNQLHGGELEAHMSRYDPEAFKEYSALKKQNAGKDPMELLKNNPAQDYLSRYSSKQWTGNPKFVEEAKQAYRDNVEAWTDEDVDHLFKTYYDSPAGRYSLGQDGASTTQGARTSQTNYGTPVKTQPTFGESRLSAKAQQYLKTLQSRFGDYDIRVADSDDNHKSILGGSDKEFSVVFSSEELERMTNDPDYAKEQLDKMQRMIDMSKRICEQNGFMSAFEQTVGEKDDILKSLTISTDKDGNMQFFAELDKLSDKQRERIEEKRQERAEEKKKATQDEDDGKVKSVTISASSEEELIKKFTEIDWDKVPEKERDSSYTVEYKV